MVFWQEFDPGELSDFRLTESEFVTLKQKVQILETRNEHVKSVLILIFCSGFHGVIYVIIAWSVWRDTGAWVLLGILPLFFSVLFWSAAIAGALGPKPKLLKPFLREPDEWIKRFQLFLDAESKYQIWAQRTQENFWNSLSGAEFEREVVNLLHRVGFIAQLTAGSGDRGVDIVLDNGEIIVQCKARRGPCGPAVLRELYGSLYDFGAQKAILISREGFTPAAIEFIESKPIELWDRNTLIALQKTTDN